MKFFSTPKQKGTTLVISLLVSFLVMGLAITVLDSVERTLEQAQNLQRGDHIFYGAEAGLEAAFFHHNVRGAGTDFGDLDQTPFPDSLTIPFAESGVTVHWTIDGRAKPTLWEGAEISGMIHRDEYVQLPLYWDSASDPSVDPTRTGLDLTNSVFTLFIDRPDFTFADSLKYLTTKNNDPLIGWGLVREHKTEGIQTLTASTDVNGDPCGTWNSMGTEASFICDEGLSKFSLGFGSREAPGSIPLSSNVVAVPNNISGLEGQILPPPPIPSLPRMDWKDFLTPTGDIVPDTYAVTLQGLGTFKRYDVLSSTGNDMAMKGIPYRMRVTSGAGELPKPEFEVIARVQQGAFEKTISTTVHEKSSSGVFNYVVFD